MTDWHSELRTTQSDKKALFQNKNKTMTLNAKLLLQRKMKRKRNYCKIKT